MTSEEEEVAVLERAIAVAVDGMQYERERVGRAETRAATTLAGLGVVSGFLSYYSTTVRDASSDPLLVLLFLAVAAFLLKSTFYALGTLWPRLGEELAADFPLELQGKPQLEAMKTELELRVWERKALQKVMMLRMFKVNRALRNFSVGLMLFVMMGVADILGLSAPRGVFCSLVAVLGAGIILLDRVSEHYSKVWH